MMKNKIVWFLYGIAATILVFIVNYIIFPSTPLVTEQNNCISVDEEFEFPVGEYTDIDVKESISPRAAKLFVNMPSEYTQMSDLVYFNNSLWTSGAINKGGYIEYKAILRYDLLSKKFIEYTEVDNQLLSSIFFERPLIISGNTLWSVIYSEIGGRPIAFMKYDISKDKFVSVPFTGSYFDKQIEEIGNKFQRYFLSGITGSHNGNIWFTDAYNLYEFDSVNGIVESRLVVDDNTYLSNPIIDENQNIWMLDREQGRIVKFGTKTTEVKYYNGKFQDGFSVNDFRGSNTYFDSQGRLWISDTGWFDTLSEDFIGDPIWHRIIRSPIFISCPDRTENKYIWERPIVLTETHNNIFWFMTTNSLVRLNTNNGEWCKVSTGPAYVAEDGEHTVWILYGTQLYKYKG